MEENICKETSFVMLNWKRELLANVMGKTERYIIIPRKCGRSYILEECAKARELFGEAPTKAE